jgi:hypothetical protein
MATSQHRPITPLHRSTAAHSGWERLAPRIDDPAKVQSAARTLYVRMPPQTFAVIMLCPRRGSLYDDGITDQKSLQRIRQQNLLRAEVNSGHL